jgi:hypothetical protein
MFHKRKFTPTNPQKYSGDPSNIIMRSSWETKFANWCDVNPSIISWVSEETVIPYRCGTDNKIHRYFVDFKIQVKETSGRVKTYLVEIKPYKQTIPPVYPGRQTQRYLQESFAYIKNQSKWEAATQYAKERGWEFIKLTEHNLGV